MKGFSRTAAILLGAALAGAAAAGPPAHAQSGRFVLMSDVHLNPFLGTEVDEKLVTTPPDAWPALYDGARQPVSGFGEDATVPLFEGALADAAAQLPRPDFVLYPGDVLVHGLKRRLADVDASAGQAALEHLAAGTTHYLASRLRETFADVPILLALGNTDTACEDYQVEPQGAYLAAAFPIVERLAGPQRLAPDAAQTFAAGGYYEAQHPTLQDTSVIVLNNILWSPRFEDTCGKTSAKAAGTAMLDWFTARLEAAEAEERRVWLVLHIPPGINAFDTARQDGACEDTTKVYGRPEFRDAFEALMDRHGARITAAFSGHIHHASFRLFPGASGPVVTIAPAISPIFGNNPSYQILDYDTASGAVTDRATRYVSNLEAATKGAPLTFASLAPFSQSYDGPYGRQTLAAVSEALTHAEPSAARTAYNLDYGAGHGTEPSSNWPVYGCAPGHVTMEDFTRCRCP